MKYAILQVSDGNFLVKSEHGEDIEAALVAYGSLFSALWAEKSVKHATIMIADENLNVVMGMKNDIGHDEPAPEPEE